MLDRINGAVISAPMVGTAALTAVLAATALAISAFVAPATAQDGVASDEKLRIGYVLHVTGNPFIKQIHDHALQAGEDLGVEVITAGPQAYDVGLQLKDVEDLNATGVDGIVTSIPGEAMVRTVNELIDGGLPVVQVNISSQNLNAMHIGERSVESGRILGRAILEQIGGDSAEGKVLMGICAPGMPLLENRGIGVKESLSSAKGLEVLGPFNVKDDATENYANWERLYAANPDAIAMVGLCASDVTSLGRLRAQYGADFIAGGYDLTPSNLQQIRDGHAFVSMGQTPFVQGYLGIKAIVDHLRDGTPLEQGFVNTGTSLVTRDKVELPYGLPSITFEELLEIESDPQKAYAFYKPLFEEGGALANWSSRVQPLSVEAE